MTHIKSALEIALERTEGVTGDKEKIEADASIKEGKRIASAFLSIGSESEAKELRESLGAYSGKKLGWVREGIFQVLLANIVLPLDDGYHGRLAAIGSGMPDIIGDKKKLSTIFTQLEKFFQQYLDNKAHIREQLEQQLEPRLRQREAQLSKQVGSKVRLNPLQDPEFVSALQKNYAMLDERYQEVLGGLKTELRAMFDSSR